MKTLRIIEKRISFHTINRNGTEANEKDRLPQCVLHVSFFQTASSPVLECRGMKKELCDFSSLMRKVVLQPVYFVSFEWNPVWLLFTKFRSYSFSF